MLGVRRTNTKPRNPQAHGKAEASHRPLNSWFVKELKHQPIVDETHLQELLNATIEVAYHHHRHGTLKMPPAEAFQSRPSSRKVSVERLYEVFLQKDHRVIRKGNVVIDVNTYRVPEPFNLQKRINVYADPVREGEPMIRTTDGSYQKLESRMKQADPRSHRASHQERVYPPGSLSPLLERYRGRTLPNASAGFGLPEIYEALSVYAGRHVPAHAHEIEIITQLVNMGPFLPEAFHAALKRTKRRLGTGRPLQQVIDDLMDQVQQQPPGKGDMP
jgi:hypothetical protein